ncbi:MAG TPA: DUF1566 domain-containing protein [Gammaproteobacteria bacterium]
MNHHDNAGQNNSLHYLHTGQISCHDADGNIIPCAGSSQDAEFHTGQPWPQPRFQLDGEIVQDKLTGLIWPCNANLADFPLNWQEALDFVAALNTHGELGFNDWRLPNRRELRSLMSHQTRRPALPDKHPFHNVFSHWYWSSTSCAGYPDHAWYVNLDGARMFYGGKDQAFMVWPVRGKNNRLPRTGQNQCYNTAGHIIPCDNSGQDGEYTQGIKWPQPRFEQNSLGVVDHLTGLLWMQHANLTNQVLRWEQALARIAELNRKETSRHWRLPNINELESLVDASQWNPALPANHPFNDVQDIYWSSTTSLYEPDWAWALYLNKGAVGVGQKSFARFHVWPVTDAD